MKERLKRVRFSHKDKETQFKAFADNLRGQDIFGILSAILFKGTTFVKYLFSFRYSNPLLKRGLLLMENCLPFQALLKRVCPKRKYFAGSKLFPFRIGPFSEGQQIQF